MKVRLSKRIIDAAEYQGSGGCYLWDETIMGFGLRIYPTGRKSFVITYSALGKQRFYTLGRYGELTLHQAKAEALETLARVHRGEDPSATRQADRQAPTVADLAKRHIDEHAAIKLKPRSVRSCSASPASGSAWSGRARKPSVPTAKPRPHGGRVIARSWRSRRRASYRGTW